MEETAPNYKTTADQFQRFVVIGVMNTVINFAVLNLLSFIFNITKGAEVIWIAAAAFIVATSNSYYFNKRFTFKDQGQDHGQKITLFLAVSLVGIAINLSIIYFITSNIDPMFGVSDRVWLNFANAAAIGISLFWNFAGFKLIVFKK